MTNSVLGNNKKHLTFIGKAGGRVALFLRKYPMALNVAHIIFVVVTFVNQYKFHRVFVSWAVS